MTPPEVAEGIFRLGTRWANFHLLVAGQEAILVDAGYPRYWPQIPQALDELGLEPRSITAVLVTHHHVDHVGTAERVRRETGAAIYAHADDAEIVRGERRSHVPPRFYRQSWRPSMARYLVHTVVAGGARYRPVEQVEVLSADGTLDLPGRPRVIQTPGHTAGHYSVAVEERGVLFAGDAMINFDYASGEAGLRLHRFNEDRARAVDSLARFDGLDADTVLFGHGDPWTKGLRRALEAVRNAEDSGRAARRSPRGAEQPHDD
jgi:glyoxylase-like metal-dependent hydrolase (beta-lactamase superfamily II)